MRQLTKTELKRKQELHPDLQAVAEAARAICDFYYICGARGKDDQELAFKKGVTKVHYPDSKHNRSKNPEYKSDAVDAGPFKFIRGVPVISWDDYPGFLKVYKAFQQASKTLGIKIRSGADFDGDGNLRNDPWVDMPHHELK